MSKLFSWTEKYEVKVAKLDHEHQTLFKTVNELDEALAAGKGRDVVAGVLKKLIDYTATHFQDEEAIMAKHSFPGLAAHRVEHQKLVEEVLKFQADYSAGKHDVAITLMPFLQNWLKNHILHTDKKYSQFLNEHGVH